MSDHHDNHHSTEQKPVSFTVPLIMASVFLFIMVLLLSVCDPKHGCACKEDCSKECMEKCEKNDHSMHDEHGNEIKGAASTHDEHATEPREEVKDSTATSEHGMVKDSTSEHHAH